MPLGPPFAARQATDRPMGRRSAPSSSRPVTRPALNPQGVASSPEGRRQELVIEPNKMPIYGADRCPPGRP